MYLLTQLTMSRGSLIEVRKIPCLNWRAQTPDIKLVRNSVALHPATANQWWNYKSWRTLDKNKRGVRSSFPEFTLQINSRIVQKVTSCQMVNWLCYEILTSLSYLYFTFSCGIVFKLHLSKNFLLWGVTFCILEFDISF